MLSTHRSIFQFGRQEAPKVFFATVHPEFFLALSLDTVLCFQSEIFWAAFRDAPVGFYAGTQVILLKGSRTTRVYLWIDINIPLTHFSRALPLPLCDELITRPEESYRLWCVVVCDEWGGLGSLGGCRAKNKQTNDHFLIISVCHAAITLS